MFLTLCALGAAGLSLGYVAHYLAGGPRIIDATSYYLQARALAEGHFAWPASDPSASVRGRFLLFHDGQIAGIFPPGYPLLLAAGFKLGAPMLVGPALAAALVIATYALAFEACRERPELAVPVARTAALLSVASAALRYHTADTMSHGATALWLTSALALALAGRRTSRAGLFALAGVAIGMALATRPVSAVAIGGIALFMALRTSKSAAGALLGGLVPGAALLVTSQTIATGSPLGSTQLAYYATSDGPAGCFRYGFGAGIGCLYEHGDFVRARLDGGYGVVASAGTTLRRLHLHLSDAFNAWPLGLAFAATLPRTARAFRASRWLLALVACQIAAYAPFYFDGNYPGGGARLFADVIPTEHALAAMALSGMAPAMPLVRRAGLALAAMLLGFSLHASFDHLLLRGREGGRPMFLAADLSRAGVTRGLVFVDTDHAFGLAFEPEARAPDREVVIARLRGDDHDAALRKRLGDPAAFVHHYGLDGHVTVTPLAQRAAAAAPGWSFEAEAEWPPLAQSGAWAAPAWTSHACASMHRVLEVRPTAAAGEVVIALPVPESGNWEVGGTVVRVGSPAAGEISVRQKTASASARWTVTGAAADACESLTLGAFELAAGEALVTIRAEGGPIAVDRLYLRPGDPR